jgi:hypothetical protein
MWINALGVEYAAANPGSSFDAIQESIVNYGGYIRSLPPSPAAKDIPLLNHIMSEVR